MGANEKLRVSADLGRDVTINMGLMIEVLLVPHDDVGGGLRVGVVLVSEFGIIMGTTLGVFMVPIDGIGCGLGEGTQYGNDVSIEKENTTGKNKGKG